MFSKAHIVYFDKPKSAMSYKRTTNTLTQRTFKTAMSCIKPN